MEIIIGKGERTYICGEPRKDKSEKPEKKPGKKKQEAAEPVEEKQPDTEAPGILIEEEREE